MKKVSKLDFDPTSLTPRQRSQYEDAIEVLRLMRNDATIKDATKKVGISISTAKKYIESSLKTKNKILVPKVTDNLIREMRIYENGEEKWILVRKLAKASKIGKYLSATGQLIDKNNKEALKQFEGRKVKDIYGKFHTFETNPKKISDIFEKREEPEFFTIYKRR